MNITPLLTYASVGILITISGGIATHVYGNMCGIDVTDPSTWMYTLSVINSPTCKTLMWYSQFTSYQFEWLWAHAIAACTSNIVYYISDLGAHDRGIHT